jgi:FkbM family methyltransferase
VTTLKQAAGALLPPALAVELRARFGDSREPELALVPRLVRAGDTALDVGAHKGLYTFWLARAAGPSGHVVAYEPLPELAGALRRATRSRRLAHVAVRECALGEAAGEARLAVPVRDGAPVPGHASLEGHARAAGSRELDVARRVLDAEPLPRPVAFAKIDVEGHELEVLRGARELLRRDRPHLLVEIEARHAGPKALETCALLRGAGYGAWALGDDRRTLVPVDLGALDAPEGLNHPPGVGRYVNNVLFVHEARRGDAGLG